MKKGGEGKRELELEHGPEPRPGPSRTTEPTRTHQRTCLARVTPVRAALSDPAFRARICTRSTRGGRGPREPRQYMYTADGLAGGGRGPGAMCRCIPRRVHRDLAEPGQLGAFAFHHHHESSPARHDDGCGGALVRRPRARDGGRLLPVFQIQNRWSGGSCLLR